MDHKFLQDGLSAISAGATTLTGWSLTILGATVAGIVAGEFLRPATALRYVYLLFIPGWLLLAASIWNGDKVVRGFAAAAFTDERERLLKIGEQMNMEYAWQRYFFQLALVAFGCWLISFLIWWVFSKSKSQPKI
jgi:hypothetical protein